MSAKWIKNLPPGEYDMNQLKYFSGLSGHSSIKMVMIKYGAIVKKIQAEKCGFFKDIFVWKGFKEKNDFFKKL